MKFLIVFVFSLAAVSAYQSPAITLRDYYATNKDTRIIGGTRARAGQFPWQAAVTGYRNGGAWFCGGSLISSSWVLTAAHCAKDVRSFRIYLGGVTLSSSETGRITITSSTVIIHSGYNSNLNNDIALIKLPRAVQFTARIQPIRLPSRGETLGAARIVRVSGWGKTSDSSNGSTNNLNWVDLTTITNARCANVYGNRIVIASTVCAVGNPQHSTCFGDSGGPLILVDSNGRATQHGIVSFVSSAGCASGHPSGYVRTESQLSWIAEKTGLRV